MLFSMMTITCKIIAMFTIIMGTVVYGWMSTYNALVTGGLTVVVKFSYFYSGFYPLYSCQAGVYPLQKGEN